MSKIILEKICEEHKNNIAIICLSPNCTKRFLCLKCLRNHDYIHSKNYVPINNLVDNKNNIILFDEYKKEFNENKNKINEIKKNIMTEINKLIDELKSQIENKINETFKNISYIETLENSNNLTLEEMSTIYNKISLENKNNNPDIKINIELIKKSLSGKFNNILDSFNIDLLDDHSKLIKIDKSIYEFDTPKKDISRILLEPYSDDVYYIPGCNDNKVYHYDNVNNFKNNILTEIITLQTCIAGTYSVILNGFLYFFECSNYNGTNKLIKYDLKQNKIIDSKIILPDAVLGNSQSCYGAHNDILLITDDKNLYAVYSSNNNNKRISIALIDKNDLTINKIWNTDSLEKKQCGPIFMINNILYYIKSYDKENDAVIYSYDLLKGKSCELNIPFENKGGSDDCLTYYPHLKCLIACNKYKIYKYKVHLEN